MIASRMLKVRGRTIGADPRIQSHDQPQEDAWERSSRPPGRDAREVWVVPDHDDTVRVGTAVFGGARACLPRSKVSMIVMRPPQHGHSGRWSGGAVGSSVALGAGTASRSLALARSALRPACEQAVVPDAVEAFGQDVQQKAADELVGAKRHGAVALVATIVLVAEGDTGLGVRDARTARRRAAR